MKKLILSAFFVWGTLQLMAQEQYNVSEIISELITNGLNKKKIEYQSEELEFSLKHPQVHHINKDFVITARLANSEGTFLYKNISGEVGGHIYLPEKEQAYRLTSREGEVIAEKVAVGEVFISDPLQDKPSSSIGNTRQLVERKLPLGNNLTAPALQLESKPGAATVLLIDFDGEDISNWGYRFYQVNPSNYTDDQIRKVWEVIAADFVMFDINVTTNRSVHDSYPLTKSLICVFGEATGLNRVGGLSLVNIFGTGAGCLVNSKNGDKGVETAHIGSHEVGHAMGLFHDGTIWPGPSVAYYGGHADWAPIMGISYGKTYVTWSKGDYEFGGQKQDDLAIIGAHTGFASDDQLTKTALILGKGDSINWTNNNGIIENSDDVDTFFFELADSGFVDLRIVTAALHTDLDVEVVLLDAQSNVIVQENKVLQRDATVYALLSEGKYCLLVKSGSENSPSDGFPNYSSFGYYEISGRIEGLVKSEYDIAISSIVGFDQRCGDFIEGSVALKNTGTETISGGVLEVYVDNLLKEIIPVNESIEEDEEVIVSNITLDEVGVHEIRFKYIIDSQYQESILQNNEDTYHYFFENGDLGSVETNLEAYDGNGPFTWEITSSSDTSLVFVSGSSVELNEVSGVTQQTFCLTKECYSFNVEGNFNLCRSYAAYQNGATYTGGSIVSYNGVVYQAKWWTQKAPTSNDWDVKGSCNLGVFEITLTNETQQSVITSVSSTNYNKAYSEVFCIDSILTNTAELVKHELNVFPNPADNWLIIQSDHSLGKVSVFDAHGKLMINDYTSRHSMVLDLLKFKSGLYFIEVGNHQQTIKFIK